jgi:hypothetical protein
MSQLMLVLVRVGVASSKMFHFGCLTPICFIVQEKHRENTELYRNQSTNTYYHYHSKFECLSKSRCGCFSSLFPITTSIALCMCSHLQMQRWGHSSFHLSIHITFILHLLGKCLSSSSALFHEIGKGCLNLLESEDYIPITSRDRIGQKDACSCFVVALDIISSYESTEHIQCKGRSILRDHMSCSTDCMVWMFFSSK